MGTSGFLRFTRTASTSHSRSTCWDMASATLSSSLWVGPLQDFLDHPVQTGVADGISQLVRQPGGAQVSVGLQVHHETLPDLLLRRTNAVEAVEDHAF